jgi:rhodanese-related sulfurtransferase
MEEVEITPQALSLLLADSAVSAPVLLDVREPWEWDVVHIDGSVHMPMRQVVLDYTTLPPDKHIVAICHHGVRSLQVTHFLRHAGFQRVLSLHGGIDAWAHEIEPTMRRY